MRHKTCVRGAYINPPIPPVAVDLHVQGFKGEPLFVKAEDRQMLADARRVFRQGRQACGVGVGRSEAGFGVVNRFFKPRDRDFLLGNRLLKHRPKVIIGGRGAVNNLLEFGFGLAMRPPSRFRIRLKSRPRF